MARVFSHKEVDGMIAEAVAKATAPLLVRIAALEAELAKAKKNSSNSSKPPTKDGKKRKRGAQPGHPQHVRPIFPPEAVKHIESHTLECCPDCGGKLRLAKRSPNVLQQIEITETPTIVTEHRGLAYWCPHCRKFHYAPLPNDVVKAGLFGLRLTALVAFMKGVCHASFSTIRKFLRDIAHVDVSRGYLAKLIAKASESLAAAYAELFERLSGEAVLNIDETATRNTARNSGRSAFGPSFTRCFASTSRADRKFWSRCWARSSTACWAATTLALTASTCVSSTCWCSSVWHT